MRFLSILLVLVAGALAAAWLGGETWRARKAARSIADDPRIEAASVAPLRELNRIGLRLSDIELQLPQGAALLPSVEVWGAPASPTTFRAALPATMALPLLGRSRTIGTEAAVLTVRVSPGAGMALGRMAAETGPVTLDGAPLLAALDAEARLMPLGAAAPPAARAAYAITAQWQDATPAGLIALPAVLAGRGLSGNGRAQVFLTGPLRQGAQPRLVGAASEGFTLTLGEQSLRIAGRVVAGGDGRAEGALFLYTADARSWMALAGELGMIPPAAVALAGTTLEQAAAAELVLPETVTPPAPPADGELRIPLIFRDGRVFLGPLPLGEAPRFPS